MLFEDVFWCCWLKQLPVTDLYFGQSDQQSYVNACDTGLHHRRWSTLPTISQFSQLKSFLNSAHTRYILLLTFVPVDYFMLYTTGCIVYTAGCQTSCTTWFDNRLNEQWLFVQHSSQTGCQTAVSCIQTFNGLSNRFDNRLDVCLHDTADCQTGCTTGCIV